MFCIRRKTKNCWHWEQFFSFRGGKIPGSIGQDKIFPKSLTSWLCLGDCRLCSNHFVLQHFNFKEDGKVVCVTFFFFLCGSTTLYRVLAFSTNSFHFPLSWARVFQFGTFNFCISFLVSSTQCVLCLPIGLLEIGFQQYTAFTILVSCILSMWPSQLSLCAQMKFIVSLFFV